MIICVGREFGSGGHEIAKRLAQNLQIDFWDKELLDQVIEQSSLPAEKLAAVDEKKANPWLHRVWYDQNDKELRGKPANEILFILQSRLILEQAQKGSCIFVGRFADQVLRQNDVEHISLFVAAPFEKRVERKCALTGMDAKAMSSLIKKTDAQRRDYYNHHTGRSWGSISNYDVCINSASLGIDRTALALTEFCRKLNG